MEKDDEVSGEGNSYDYGARIYDSRVGRFLSLDPLSNKNISESNYSYAANNPIYFIDEEGKDNIVYLVVTDSKNSEQVKVNAQEIANEANAFYKELGVKTRVVVFDESTRGKFNLDFMDKTDSYAVVGNSDDITKRTGLPSQNGALENASSGGNVIGVDVNALNKYSTLPFKSKEQMIAFAIVHGSGHNAEPVKGFHADKTDKDIINNSANFMSEGCLIAALFEKEDGFYFSEEGENFVFPEVVQKLNPDIKTIMDLFDKKRNKTNIKNFKNRFGINKAKDNYNINKFKSDAPTPKAPWKVPYAK